MPLDRLRQGQVAITASATEGVAKEEDNIAVLLELLEHLPGSVIIGLVIAAFVLYWVRAMVKDFQPGDRAPDKSKSS